MKIKIKRIYEKPDKNDGIRILVDRLWPRGVSKKESKIDLWAKEIAPSNKLRSWFHQNKKEKLVEFSKRYQEELKKNKKLIDEIFLTKNRKTLVTSVKDIENSHIPTLVRFLSK